MRLNISTVAKQELDRSLSHGSTAKEAVASLMARAKQDPGLYRQLMDPWLKDACQNAIDEQRYRNQEIRKGFPPTGSLRRGW